MDGGSLQVLQACAAVKK